MSLCVALAHSAVAQDTPSADAPASQASPDPREASDAQARAHFASGQVAVEEGLFGEAYAQFAAGYALSRRPLFLFNMAECARQNGQVETARNDYERYLEAEPDGSMEEVARARLRDLPAPPEAEAPAPDISAAHAAASAAGDADVAEPNLRSEDTSTPLRRKWQFWTVLGAVVVAAGAAVAIGVAASSTSPQCDGACELVDLR